MAAREGIPLYIVDGYNVIFSRGMSPGAGSVEDARLKLIRLLDSYGRKKKVEIVVVWDGGSPVSQGLRGKSSPRSRAARSKGGPDAGPVRSLQSGQGQSADEKIVRLVERHQQRKRIWVVSNDRRHIVGVVRNLGAKAMGVEEFLGMVGFGGRGRGPGTGAPSKARVREVPKAPDAQKEKSGASDLSVEDWLTLFRGRGE